MSEESNGTKGIPPKTVPSDWSSLPESCAKNEDCGADFCQQKGDKCIEIKYICENEKCFSTTKEFPNYTCGDNKCKEIKEDETANWKSYRNEEYGFEIKYPENQLLYPPLKTSLVEYVSNNYKYFGVRLGEFNNGCSLNIFKTDRSKNINPFDESDVPIKMRIYAVSKDIEFNNTTYHFGMSVASHAVNPDSCRLLLN